MTVHKIVFLSVAVAAWAVVPAGATTSHKILNTVLESGNPNGTLSSGYTTLETASVRCPDSTCTLSMSIMQNVSEATCQSEWAIVGLVDGNSVDGGPYVSQLPGSGKHVTRDWQGQYTVTYGKHTIAYQIYLPCSANANQWSVMYLVTTP